MTLVLKKANGDLFLDPETGRSTLIGGPSKVDQELASLYLTRYDPVRRWGSEIEIETFGPVSGMHQMKAVLYLRVQQANQRLMAKQARDPTLDQDFERIQKFSSVQVRTLGDNQSAIFLVVADVGNEQVAKTIGLNYEPTELGQVSPPPFDLIAKGG